MTTKLNELIAATAETIVAQNKDCFFDTTAIKNTKAQLTTFAKQLLAEMETQADAKDNPA